MHQQVSLNKVTLGNVPNLVNHAHPTKETEMDQPFDSLQNPPLEELEEDQAI